MGVVYLATDPHLKREVAIKTFRRARLNRLGSPAEAAKSFLDEGQCVARMSHPGIVKVLDYGESEDECFLVSEYVPGGTLADRLRLEPLSVSESVEIVARVAEAAAHAHARDVFHRDIKPANILLRDKCDPILADFGVALLEDGSQSLESSFVGTFVYMSPEQLDERSHLVDGRADVYALGIVLYECLTGRLPYKPATPKELLALLKMKPPRPPRELNATIPADVEAICLKCLQFKPEDRFTTATDLASALRRTRPTGLRTTILASLVVGILALVVVGMAVGAGGLTGIGRDAPRDAARGPVAKVEPTEPALFVRRVPFERPPQSDAVWDVDPVENRLAAAGHYCLLALGRHAGGETVLELDLERQSSEGMIGLFYGLGFDAAPRSANTAETLELNLFPDQRRLDWNHRIEMTNERFSSSASYLSAKFPVAEGAQSMRLRLVEDAPVELSLRQGDFHVDLAKLPMRPSNPEDGPNVLKRAKGEFGVFVIAATGRFSRVRVNGVAGRLAKGDR